MSLSKKQINASYLPSVANESIILPFRVRKMILPFRIASIIQNGPLIDVSGNALELPYPVTLREVYVIVSPNLQFTEASEDYTPLEMILTNQ